MKLREIAELLNGRITGNPDMDISGAAGISDAGEGDITFLAGKKNLHYAYSTRASAIIAGEEIKDISASMVIVDNPHLAFARTLEVFYKKPLKPLGISQKAVIGAGVNLGDSVSIHPLAYIGDNVSIGSRVVIFPHVYIGENVSVGDDSIIYPNVAVRENVKIGRKVVIHSGTIIGSDGFGYVKENEMHCKIPHVGGVIIGDDVEIGANVTIDRATTGNTIIGSGTKIDNHVQVAHNVRIGKNCLIVAQVAVGGSAELSDGAVIGGQAAVRDHVKIGRDVMVGGQSGVGHDIPDGQVYSGTPAIPHKTWLRSQSIYSRLPEYIRRLHELERKIKKEE